MDIKTIAENLKNGINNSETIIGCEEVSVTDTDRIYVSILDSVDAHEINERELNKLGCSIEDYVLDQTEGYLNWLLSSMGIDAEIDLDCEIHKCGKCVWVYGDIVID